MSKQSRALQRKKHSHVRTQVVGVLWVFSVTCLAQTPLQDRGSDPAAKGEGIRTVSDAKAHLSFELPSGWNLSREDGILSTFHLDAETAATATGMRWVAQLGYNPYPLSTFSGALFYLSLTPHSTARACAAQATSKPAVPMGSAVVGDQSFDRGASMHGKICTEARDTIYTALRRGSCVRFDLVINSFCGGEVSGAHDLTEAQLRAIELRLEGILHTVRFDAQ